MDALGTFDRLVAELSLGERRELFRKLEALNVVSTAPLFRQDELPEEVFVERKYREASWFFRTYLQILSIFSGKPPLKLFEDRLIARLGSAVAVQHPGLFDARRNLLLGGMHAELQSLKESARFFYDALDGSVVRDKGAFFAFLASLEMDFIHRRLATETDPFVFAAGNSQALEADIRNALNRNLESILESIDEQQRKVMYRNVRSLLCLKELAAFLFDRTLTPFSGVGDARTCPAYLLVDQLMVLNDILYSMDFPPSMSLLESLFIFDLQDRVGTDGFDLEAETKKLVVRAEEALTRIRQFNQRVPLTAILRCASRNLSYLPSVITGGEDWFATYRDFWRKRLEERFGAFVKEHRREQLAESLAVFFGGKPIPRLRNAFSSENTGGFPVKSSFLLSFLVGFYRYVFSDEVNRILKVLLLDGEFYKKDNRVEFTDAYNELLKLNDTIEAFDRKIAPTGDLGSRYDFAGKEMIALPIKRRKFFALQQEANEESAGIVERAGKALRSLQGVLGGVLHGESGGRYDTLSNLGALSGRGSTVFISSLRNALQKIEKAVQMLGEIESVESGR